MTGGRHNAAVALLAVVGTLASVHAPAAAQTVPPLDGRVNDLAQVLAREDQQRLASTLARYESETGHQFALLTLPSLEGYPIEAWGIRVAEAWQLGSEARDDGLIFLVAPNDRKMRI